jgi:hypothetical protein
MSIQQSLYKGLVYRAFQKFKIIQLYDHYLFLKQYLFRKFIILFYPNKKNPNVFLEYYSHYTHPDIKKRYYGKNAPLSWTNSKSAEVFHLINFSKEFLEKKIIFEPNDCCQKLGSFLDIHQPYEFVSRCKEIDHYIASKVISRVLVGNNDVIKHAEYYFSHSVLKKFVTYPEMSCIPKVTKFFIEEKHKKLLLNSKIRFLSIASDFKKKAVDLLIEAFIESQSLNTLILVCHNVPESYRVKILKAKNIKLLENIPIPSKIKDDFYRNSDVYINTTYIDGGATVVNALEYGLPVITFTYHRGKSYIANENGVLISEPLKYYDPKSYGIHWNSIDGYLEQVVLLKNNGGYESVKKQLIDSIMYYQLNPKKILIEGLNSLELAKKNSLDNANQILRNLYKQVASE